MQHNANQKDAMTRNLEKVHKRNRDSWKWTPGYEVYPASMVNVFVGCIQNGQKLHFASSQCIVMCTFDGYSEEVCVTKSVECVLTQKFCPRCMWLWVHEVGWMTVKCIKLHGTPFEIHCTQMCAVYCAKRRWGVDEKENFLFNLFLHEQLDIEGLHVIP